MKLKITLHFQDRMQDRELSLDDVKKAMRDPDTKEIVFEGKIKVTKRLVTGKSGWYTAKKVSGTSLTTIY